MFLLSHLNLDLLAVGVTTAAIAILGFMTFFRDSKSSTNRAFLGFAGVTVAYSIVNYLSYQVNSPVWTIWLLRGTIFCAVWHGFSFFNFAYVFPRESFKYPTLYKWLLVPFTAAVAGLTLTPLVFAGLQINEGAGSVSQAILGPAIPLFALTTFILTFSGLGFLIKKMIKAEGLEKKQYIFILIGTIVTFLLITVFNLVLPLVFQQVRYIPLAAIFFFPLVAFTTYAILKHHLLSAKVISAEILAFALSIVTLSEVILSRSLMETLFRTGEFGLVLIFGLLLIKGVLQEVEQREELEVLNAKLDAANQQLEELSRFKSQLLSLASHQIRAPLGAIKGFGELIANGTYGPIPDKAKETLEKINGLADELIGLINTLLDLRKVEEGKMEYQFARADLGKLTGEVVELLKPLADTKKLEFTFVPPTQEIPINADAEKLKQVVQNLIDNAIKYTPSGFVRIELGMERHAAVVTVSDSGLGIPATLVPHLFEEFIRDERVKQEIRGTGLGLYIARKITEAHGGKLWASSKGEGQGSTFRLTLPILR